MKTCTKCGTDKPASEFGRDARRKSGLQAWCLLCYREKRNRQYADDAEFRGAARERAWASRLVRLYGITAEDYWRMWREQEGVCAICLCPCPSGQRLAVDHEHWTMRVRGLLCIPCNTNLGILEGWAVEYKEVVRGYLR